MNFSLNDLNYDDDWIFRIKSSVIDEIKSQIPNHPPTEDCPDDECMICGMRDCPHEEPLHFHHDGCPACYYDEPYSGN